MESKSCRVMSEESDNKNLIYSNAEFLDPIGIEASCSVRFPATTTKSPETNFLAEESTITTATTAASATKFTTIRNWLTFYSKFCQSSRNQDNLLKLLQWSLWMVSYYYSGKQSRNTYYYNASIQKWISKFSDEISWARYVTRLLDFPVAVEAAMNDSWTISAKKDSSLTNSYRFLGKVLAYSMVAYHPTEAMAYWLWKKPSSVTFASTKYQWKAETWSYISCRFWLTYTLAELTQCLLQWRDLHQQKIHLEKIEGTKEDLSTSSEFMRTRGLSLNKQQLLQVQLQTIRDALFLLPCIHWSLPKWDAKPWLSPHMVNTLMWCEAVVCMYQAIQKFKLQAL